MSLFCPKPGGPLLPTGHSLKSDSPRLPTTVQETMDSFSHKDSVVQRLTRIQDQDPESCPHVAQAPGMNFRCALHLGTNALISLSQSENPFRCVPWTTPQALEFCYLYYSCNRELHSQKWDKHSQKENDCQGKHQRMTTYWAEKAGMGREADGGLWLLFMQHPTSPDLNDLQTLDHDGYFSAPCTLQLLKT